MSKVTLDSAAEKRVTHIVYCSDQLVSKRSKLWGTRYDRACQAAQSVEELDEAMRRIHAKHPHLGLDEIMAKHQ